MLEASIISAAQKVEHYKIVIYLTLHQFAKKLSLIEVAELLKITLKEGKSADNKLLKVAISAINIIIIEAE